ncbi:dolichyl-phosphate-mannose--protein mannosyltransferase, partial [Streptomyces sp. SID10244]|nr:dolichyl-phosphate-mannose--protein mannosyltransferase [Streptomyces sp. SID10244]
MTTTIGRVTNAAILDRGPDEESGLSADRGRAEDLGTRPGPEIPTPLFGAPDRRRGLLVGLVIAVVATATRLWGLAHPTDQGT